MDAKGKVVSVGKCWDSMYPAMAEECTATKARVEIELQGGGCVTLHVPAAEASTYRFGAEVSVSVQVKASPLPERK